MIVQPQSQPTKHTSQTDRDARNTNSPSLPWYTRLALLILSAALLTFAFAPFSQFYLAFFALVPWLYAIARTRTGTRAFLWGWLGGILFFLPNFAYLFVITAPGAIALCIYMALFWALAAAAIRSGSWLDPDRSSVPLLALFAVPIIWTATEWLRGTLLTGLPWLFLGHSQSPFLALCQLADTTGVYGITFCIVLVNTLLYFLITRVIASKETLQKRLRPIFIPTIATAVILVLTLAYGFFRLSQKPFTPGPRVLVVQPNDRFVRGKQASDTQEQSLTFHLQTTLEALSKDKEKADLVVWSETTMPPLNPEAREHLARESSGPFLRKVHEALSGLTRVNRTALLAGGYYVAGWNVIDGKDRATDIRNAAYLYNPIRQKITRYDKVHIVPFGEFIPFKFSLPWLFQAFMFLSPYTEEYTVSAGHPGALTAFEINPGAATPSAAADTTWRFVSPICFEDIDAPLVAAMFRPEANGKKRADFIVNITNDGWFRFNEMPHHLQVAIFRSIENRAPTARSVNTGISGFIDSVGRTSALIPVGTSGASSQRLALDSRLTFYTRFGDLFAITCTTLTVLLLLIRVIQHYHRA